MNKFIVGLSAGAAALVTAAVAVAAPVGDQTRGPRGPQTRAELVQKLDARFAQLDTNRDGTVTAAERQAQHEARRAAMFDRMDANKDGGISRTEFAAAGERGRGGGHGMKGGHGRFGMHRGGAAGGTNDRMGMDANRDGQLTKAEFEARALARFDKADADRNGVLTPAERQQAWAAHRGNRS